MKLLSKNLRRRSRFSYLRLGSRTVRVDEQANRGGRWRQLVQEFDCFGPQDAGVESHAADVALRPVEARHDAHLDRVIAGREDDRNGCCRRLGRDCCIVAGGHILLGRSATLSATLPLAVGNGGMFRVVRYPQRIDLEKLKLVSIK
jgi:hypothetical protein